VRLTWGYHAVADGDPPGWTFPAPTNPDDVVPESAGLGVIYRGLSAPTLYGANNAYGGEGPYTLPTAVAFSANDLVVASYAVQQANGVKPPAGMTTVATSQSIFYFAAPGSAVAAAVEPGFQSGTCWGAEVFGVKPR
jgi:hypothetical protein